MVTHIPPPSPSFSSTSLSSSATLPFHSTSQSTVGVSGHPSSSSSRYAYTRGRSDRPPTLPQSAFPPSPPSSYATSNATESQYAETVVPPRHRRAPSVASRASTSAARPHGRQRSASSSRGDVSQQTSNAFPWFSQTGDVEIVIRDRTGRRKEKRYLLHSLILAQNCGFFASELGDAAVGPTTAAVSMITPVVLQGGSTFERMSQEAPPRSRSGSFSSLSGSGSSKKRWRYELDWGKASAQGEDALPVLVQCDPLAPAGQPPPASSLGNKPYQSSFRNLSLTHINTSATAASHTSGANDSATEVERQRQRDDDLIIAYDNLFRAVYNHTPRLDTTTLATAYVECKTLLSLASLYSALPAAGPRVDHHLLRFQGRLWRQIAKYPPSYLKLGHLARSRAIFNEALIHVVGAWPAHAGQLKRGQIDNVLLDLILDKVDELADLRQKIEAKLFRLSLTTSRGERVSPTSNWSDWLAVSLFRQFLTEESTPPPSSILKDRQPERQAEGADAKAIGRLFRLLNRGGEAYLSHEDVKKFVKLSGLSSSGYSSRETVRRFERRVDELKNLARDAVKPLARSLLELEESRVAELPYLTCTKMSDRDWDYVWGE